MQLHDGRRTDSWPRESISFCVGNKLCITWKTISIMHAVLQPPLAVSPRSAAAAISDKVTGTVCGKKYSMAHCGGVAFSKGQVPTQPLAHSPSSVAGGREKKGLWIEIKTGRLRTNYCDGR